jgi:hypothetical protein
MRTDVIEVPISVVKLGNPIWKEQAFFYALDNFSFGITGEHFPKWRNVAGFYVKVKPRHVKKKIRLNIPKKFQEFYHLEDSHRTVTVSDNNILVTMTGRFIRN